MREQSADLKIWTPDESSFQILFFHFGGKVHVIFLSKCPILKSFIFQIFVCHCLLLFLFSFTFYLSTFIVFSCLSFIMVFVILEDGIFLFIAATYSSSKSVVNLYQLARQRSLSGLSRPTTRSPSTTPSESSSPSVKQVRPALTDEKVGFFFFSFLF